LRLVIEPIKFVAVDRAVDIPLENQIVLVKAVLDNP
jgi:hypothetical protein